MSPGRLFSTLVVVALVVASLSPVLADSGSAVPVASGSGVTVPPDILGETDALKGVATAYHNKDWFLLAGAALALVIHGVRWLLAKKWPRWGESHYGVLLAAGLAGVASLSIAWASNLDPGSSHTLLGALKIFAYATVAYVVPKKVIQGMSNTGTASSSDVPN